MEHYLVENQLLLVSEWAECNLRERFRQCRLKSLPGIPREELLRYLEGAATALDALNQQGLCRLDVTPANLRLVNDHLKVAGLELAQHLDPVASANHTFASGTPLYMAPETWRCEVSAFCDQYSLAVVYQEMLTGRAPFDGTDLRQLMMQHTAGKPVVALLPRGERHVIGRAS